jgi:hypothetical protein
MGIMVRKKGSWYRDGFAIRLNDRYSDPFPPKSRRESNLRHISAHTLAPVGAKSLSSSRFVEAIPEACDEQWTPRELSLARYQPNTQKLTTPKQKNNRIQHQTLNEQDLSKKQSILTMSPEHQVGGPLNFLVVSTFQLILNAF